MKNTLPSKNLPLVATGIPAAFCNPKTKTTSSLKGFLTLVVMVLLVGNVEFSFGQTNPAAFALSGGSFTFASQTATSTTYPTNMQGWTTGTANIATLTTAAPAADYTLIASGTASTSGLSNLGANGFNFLTTSNASYSQVGAICLSLNTTGRTSELVTWTVADQLATASLRVMNLTLQYRVGTSGVFTTVANSTYTTSSSSQAAAQTFANIALPTACDNQSVVQIRWIFYESAAQSGSRDAIRLDDITVSSTAAGPTISGAATATAFQTIYGNSSSPKLFGVSGSNLTANLVATAPTGFEVSIDGINWQTTATLNQTSGTASGTFRVRLAATAAVGGTYNSQTIALTSTGATQVNITTAASGNLVAASLLTITGLTGANKNYDGNTSASFTGSAAYSGLKNSEIYSVTGTPTAVFSSAAVGTGKTITISGYTAPSTNYSLTQPALSANIIAVVPGAPTIGAATAGNGQANVAFSAPSFTGGASITGYTVTSSPDGITASGATSPITITGLTNGTAYTFSVVATNSAGNSTSSGASNSVTPSSVQQFQTLL
jgi:hypothetical protein